MDGDVLIDPEASLQPRRQVVIVFPPLGGQRVNLGRQLCSTPHPHPPSHTTLTGCLQTCLCDDAQVRE